MYTLQAVAAAIQSPSDLGRSWWHCCNSSSTAAVTAFAIIVVTAHLALAPLAPRNGKIDVEVRQRDNQNR